MGNEASRPSMDVSPRAAGGPAPPTPTPHAYGAARRTQSFPTRSPSPAPSSSPSPLPPASAAAPPRVAKTIQRMDKTIRRRVRGGITYNMKLLIRGDRGSGKTSLFHRLQGLPIPSAHVPTPQLQTATINWNLRVGTEESVKCEVWDVVDRGFVPSEDAEGGADATAVAAVSDDDVALASAAAAAAAAAMGGYTTAGSSGMHAVAAVDASTVDVYHEAHGVIFLLDVTKWESLEYVRQQLDEVPPHIPTLVLGNFRDCAAHQRKVFKEDIQDLLYGSSDRSLKQQQALRRPIELLYFECSLLNCYGLKALHQYFGIPFLQLKLETIRQQLRIVEGEFSHLKNDLQATIREQRYVDYLEHIKATGSDIRTGRRASSGQQHHADTSSPRPASEGNGQSPRHPTEKAAEKVARRSSSITSDTGDVVVSANGHGSDHSSDAATTSHPNSDATEMQQDLGDLPERDSSSFVQVMPPLKIQHIEPVTGAITTVEEVDTSGNDRSGDSSAVTGVELERASALDAVDTQADVKGKSVGASKAKSSSAKKTESGKTQSGRMRKPSVDEPVGLEDFQVPGQRNSDLDHFYSEDESEEEEGEDEDVVVTVADTGLKKMASGRSHKQVFIDSDSSDSEQGTQQSTRKNAPLKSKGRAPSSPRRQGRTHEAEESAGPNDLAMPSKQRPVSPPSLPVTPPRPPQPSRNASVSPRPRLQSSSPPRSPLSRSAQLDTSGSTAGRDPVSTMPLSAGEPLRIEDLSASVGEGGSSHSDTGAESPTAGSLSHAQSTPTSPHAPTEPRRDNEYKSPNSSRRNSLVSATSADFVEVSTMGIDDMHEPREVDSEQSPRSVASGQDPSVPDHRVEDYGVETTKATEVYVDETSQSMEDSPVESLMIDDAAARLESANLEQQGQHIEGGKLTVGGADVDEFTVDTMSLKADMNAFLMNDADSKDEGASGSDAAAPERARPSLLSEPASRRPDVLASNGDDNDGDDDNDDNDDNHEEAPITPAQDPTVSQSSRSVVTSLAPASDLQAPLVAPKSDLEAFLNEDESDSDGGADLKHGGVAGTLADARTSSDEDDVDDENTRLRLSAYNASRKSRAQRRMEREELRQFSEALDASQRDVDASAASSATDRGAGSIENSDVLAAIRRAQEEAARMMESVESGPAEVVETPRTEKKRREKKDKPRKKSSRRASGEDAEDRARKHRSSRSSSSKASRSRRHLVAGSESE